MKSQSLPLKHDGTQFYHSLQSCTSGESTTPHILDAPAASVTAQLAGFFSVAVSATKCKSVPLEEKHELPLAEVAAVHAIQYMNVTSELVPT